MDSARPIYATLDALNDGRVISRVVSVALLVFAVGMSVGAVLLMLFTLGLTFKVAATPDSMIGGVLQTLIVGVSGYVLFEVIRYRARNVRELGASSFTVIPIVSLLLRLTGESYAVVVLTTALTDFVFRLFGVSFVRDLGFGGMFAPPASIAPWAGVLGAFGGAMTAVFSLAFAFGGLLFFYFLAEAALLVADIARNVQRLVGYSSPVPAVTIPLAAAMPVAVPMRRPPSCPTCSTEIADAESAFCVSCGSRLR